MRNICTIENCRNEVVGRGLCRKHYMRWKRWGDPAEPDHRSMRPTSLCDAKGCVKPVHSGGLCATHHRQRQKDNEPDSAPYLGVCEWCESDFVGLRVTRRFCSRACAQRARHDTPEYKRQNLNRYYQNRYGLTIDEVEAMRSTGCEICGRTSGSGRWGQLHIDHDHETGEVRGVLCHGCNVSLGHLNHDRNLLERAIAYLE